MVSGAYTSLRISIQFTDKTGETCLTQKLLFQQGDVYVNQQGAFAHLGHFKL